MPQLNIIISNFFEPHFSLSSWLGKNRESILSSGAIFQGIRHRRTGLPDLNQLIDEVVAHGTTPKAISLVNDLAAQASNGEDIIWLTKNIRFEALPKLRELVAGNPTFANYNVRPLMIVQNQLTTFCTLLARFWKQRTPESFMNQLSHAEASLFYYSYFAELQKVFGQNSCRFVPFTGDYAGFGDILGNTLNLSEMAPTFKPAVFPMSFAGLDMVHAVQDFPFDLLKKNDTRRQRFYDVITKIEKKDGYKVFRHLPKDIWQKFVESFSGENAAFIKEHGDQYAFLNDWPDFPEMPDPLPSISATECNAFVKALDSDFRKDLSDFFRTRRAMDPEEHLLAKTLEEYRQTHFPAAKSVIPASEPALSVLTMAYNHKDYILECMESVAAQKTDFPVQHIIVDDCSDDGTQDIIDNFASTHGHVRPIYFPYRSHGRNIRVLFNACKSQYAALCDGDDYFTEPTKLQKQVDFLENNKDCAICFHPVAVVFENKARDIFFYPIPQHLPRWPHRKLYLADLLKGNIIQTNSAVYRWRFKDGLPDWFRSDISPGDWYWHLLHAEMGKAGFIPEVMAVYRRHDKAFYHNAFIDTLAHRKERGLAELEAYKTINEHFNGRYFRILSALTNGVFDDLMELKQKGDDDGMFDKALEYYPELGLHYINTLKTLCKQ